MNDWKPIKTAPSYKAVLTQHIDDIYPVVAYFVEDPEGGGQWYREAEGPEDTMDGRSGKHELLYRTPTHWMELPISPACTSPTQEKP